MTAPVYGDDIVSGCATYLRAQPEAVAAVTTYNIGGQLTAGIFQYKPWTKIEGTSSTCVVLSNDGGWVGPNIQNTLHFPRIGVNIWADPLRDDANNVSDPGEVMRRAFGVYKVFDRFLHRTAGAEVFFGSLRVISCVRLTEPIIYVVPDGDGLVRCQIIYAATEG